METGGIIKPVMVSQKPTNLYLDNREDKMKEELMELVSYLEDRGEVLSDFSTINSATDTGVAIAFRLCARWIRDIIGGYTE